jgi:cell shape-determining protein MreC
MVLKIVNCHWLCLCREEVGVKTVELESANQQLRERAVLLEAQEDRLQRLQEENTRSDSNYA